VPVAVRVAVYVDVDAEDDVRTEERVQVYDPVAEFELESAS